MTIYERLAEIATDNPQLLTAYHNDLHVHDRKSCEIMRKGDRYVWLLRAYGTQMFPLNIGHAACWLTYWLDGNDTTIKPIAFLINAQGPNNGTVNTISLEKARELAEAIDAA